MARGRDMAAAAFLALAHCSTHDAHVTGTITELPSQSQTMWSPARCLSLMEATVDRLDLESLVQHAPRL
jgi:hypothetical protein